jgi:adenylylsulfate kinase-like enzyme
VEECARRDSKGLYARARDGELTGLTGVDAPYEPPRAPDIELTPQLDAQAAAGAVLDALGERLREVTF